jgi:hypothetical protein
MKGARRKLSLTHSSRDAQQVDAEDIVRIICCIRGQRVILDFELARLYGVPTKRLNEQLRRNRARFPDDFAFQLTREEWRFARCERADHASEVTVHEELAANRSQIATGSQRHRDVRSLPYAFTEHGALQAANILNSPRAVAMSVYVIRAFIKMREELASNAAILKRLAEIEKELLVHNDALRDVYEQIRSLLAPPDPDESPKEIGFHVKEDSIPYRIRRRGRNGFH